MESALKEETSRWRDSDMRVLLVGIGTFFHVGAFFNRALSSMVNDGAFVDEERYVRTDSLFYKMACRLRRGKPVGYSAFNRAVLDTVRQHRSDLVLVVKGSYLAPDTLAEIKQIGGVLLVNYATDDPFNPLVSTPDLVESIPYYDLYVCTKRAIMADVRRAGCVNVVYVPFGYEPSLHFPEERVDSEVRKKWFSSVVFVGTRDADRGPMMTKVAREVGREFHLYGGFWNRERHLRSHYRGFALGQDYRLALGCAKIALGLVRHPNRDGITMRSFEIPACGGFMLAERTEEHLEFFGEGREAAYFGSDDELLDKVRYYLDHDQERRKIARAGYDRVTSGRNTYRDRLATILECGSSMLK